MSLSRVVCVPCSLCFVLRGCTVGRVLGIVSCCVVDSYVASF